MNAQGNYPNVLELELAAHHGVNTPSITLRRVEQESFSDTAKDQSIEKPSALLFIRILQFVEGGNGWRDFQQSSLNEIEHMDLSLRVDKKPVSEFGHLDWSVLCWNAPPPFTQELVCVEGRQGNG